MKKITYLNFHPAFSPPRSGGELRYVHLATRLSETFNVRMVNPTFGHAQREEIEHTPTCIETRLPKTKRYNFWHQFFDRTAKFKECSALVSSLSVRAHREYMEEAARQTSNADIVIHASPFMGSAYPRARREGQLLIYDSYNVEAKLMAEALGNGLWGKWGTGVIKRVEGNLARNAHLVLVCSREDGDEMAELYKIDRSKIVVVPNGVDVEAMRPGNQADRDFARNRLGVAQNRMAAVFIGSFHPPNIEAAEFIINEVAPSFGGVDFLIAGKACDPFMHQPVSPNVKLLGLVSEETRNDLLFGCDIALNPMFSGSGTNLKMLDFFAVGLPVISTPIGARGLDVTSGEQAMVVEGKYFVRCMQDIISDTERRRQLRVKGREHAENKFSWKVIADNLRDLLELKTTRRVLMLNDFAMSPVNSGGRVRLEAVGKHVSETVAPVTMLTLTKEGSGRHVQHSAKLEELNVPRSRWHGWMDALLADRSGVSADDVSALLFTWLSPAYKRAVKRELPFADVLVLNHCYMWNFAKKIHGKLPVVYESYNVETVLKRALFPKNSVGRFLAGTVEKAERALMREAAFTSCVARSDLKQFIEELGADPAKTILADNGVYANELQPLPMEERATWRRGIGMKDEVACVFLGSGHPPNAEAARFIINDVAPTNPECIFLIVGSVCGWFYNQTVPENVVMMGEVEPHVKDFLMRAADIALNPLFQGSGSSLKVPEYLRAGLPVISLPVGARGFAAEDEKTIIICEKDAFAAEVRKLAADVERRKQLADEGRRIVEQQFDWAATLHELSNNLRRVMGKKVDIPSKSVESKETENPAKANMVESDDQVEQEEIVPPVAISLNTQIPSRKKKTYREAALNGNGRQNRRGGRRKSRARSRK